MNNIPIFYDYQNQIQSFASPIPQYNINNETTHYFARYILQKILSNFKFTGIPDTWQKNYVQYCLFCNGVFTVLNTPEFGVIPQACGLTGYNVFWGPKSVLVANPLLPDLSGKELVIGRDCEIVQLAPDYCGILDMCYKYAVEYALATQAFDVTLVNSKLAYVFAAGNKQVAASFKKMYDQISQGNPATFIDSALLNPDGRPSWEAVFRDQKGSGILNELLTALEKLDARLNTDIGIPNTNIAKASGVTSDEVNANNKDTSTKATLWRDTIREGLQKVNRMFGLNLGVELVFSETGRGEENADTGEDDYNEYV